MYKRQVLIAQLRSADFLKFDMGQVYESEYDQECNPEHDSALNIKSAREQLAETDEVSYYLGLVMSLWYTGTEEYIEGRNCPVFVLGTDHEDQMCIRDRQRAVS